MILRFFFPTNIRCNSNRQYLLCCCGLRHWSLTTAITINQLALKKKKNRLVSERPNNLQIKRKTIPSWERNSKFHKSEQLNTYTLSVANERIVISCQTSVVANKIVKLMVICPYRQEFECLCIQGFGSGPVYLPQEAASLPFTLKITVKGSELSQCPSK